MDRESLGSAFKALVVIAIIAGLGWLGWRKFSTMLEGPSDPHPTDPVQAATDFFTALDQQDYQKCYSLLTQERKMATGVGFNKREDYFNHFARIRRYLVQRAGNNFLEDMQVSPGGRETVFAHGITLRLSYATSHDDKKRTHYGIAEMNDFPIDVAPDIGLEARNRAMDQFIDNMATGKDPGHTQTSPVEFLIDAYETNRQLDLRHELLEKLITEYPRDPQTQKFLQTLAGDPKQPTHLRALAQQILKR